MQFIKGGPELPARLLNRHEAGQVVFFCGAGISYPAGLPDFGGLARGLFTGVGERPNAAEQNALELYKYDQAIGLLESRIQGGRSEVRKHLAEMLRPNLALAHAKTTHLALLTLARDRRDRLRAVTTNFDDIFSRVAQEARSDGFTVHPQPPARHQWHGLVHLHGLMPPAPSAQDLDSLVLSEGDFGRAYLTEGWAAKFVAELFRRFSVCFVGYSINDPVLRYMTAAHALGDTPNEMFAFASHGDDDKPSAEREWRTKNVTPILYHKVGGHHHLHKTLHVWASICRDGVIGKERLVRRAGRKDPSRSHADDNFVGRALWALGEATGQAARRFADITPPPSIHWLEHLAAQQLDHHDLQRFGVNASPASHDGPAFSLLHRPAPHRLAPWMGLANAGAGGSQWDAVMPHLARWLCRHLDEPKLVLWIAKQGGQLDAQFAWQVNHALATTPPGPKQLTYWRLLLAGLVKSPADRSDLYAWRSQLRQTGLSTTLRLQLRTMLSARVNLTESCGSWSHVFEAAPTWQTDAVAVDCDIVLNANHAHSALRDMRNDAAWRQALPELLDDATALLRDALGLLSELGRADDRRDHSYAWRHSISEHEQNHNLRDWTVLIDLARDAWLATAAQSPARARAAAELWSHGRFPLFRRLALFAATHTEVIPAAQGLVWLLDDAAWRLWSVETQRECLRLLVALAPVMTDTDLAPLERALTLGPPAAMFRDDIEATRLERTFDHMLWLRLAKLDSAGAQLSPSARAQLQTLQQRYPDQQLEHDQRDEFPVWMDRGDAGGNYTKTPRRRRALVQWLRERPARNLRDDDDWRQRCSDEFAVTASSLMALAQANEWPERAWREALQAWSEDKLHRRSWRRMAGLLIKAPEAFTKNLAGAIGWWLQASATSCEGFDGLLVGLAERVLATQADAGFTVDDDPVFQAINHPVGHVAEALLRWLGRQAPMHGVGLPAEVERVLTLVCATPSPAFRHGRVVLASHLPMLYAIDAAWTAQQLIPLLDWRASMDEAQAAWAGYLRSPRMTGPMLELIRQHFIDTAQHCEQLGRNAQHQYAALLARMALHRRTEFAEGELASATAALPAEGLLHTAHALVELLEQKPDQCAEVWASLVRPYWRSFWPKSKGQTTPALSSVIAELCVGAGQAFPDAVELLAPWLQSVTDPDLVLIRLDDSGAAHQHPAAVLMFLDAVISNGMLWSPGELSKCLAAIQLNLPSAADDSRFRALAEHARRLLP